MKDRTTGDSSRSQRLDSWKSIAQYLDRSSRTVQRWHAEYGLPIRQLGGKSGSVLAFTDELDHWLRYRGVTSDVGLEGLVVEIARPVLRIPNEAAHVSGALAATLVSPQAKVRSAELVALAHKMLETISHQNLSSTARVLREAIDVDPGNALGFAMLGFTLMAEGLWSIVRPATSYVAAKAAVRRALELAPGLTEAICANAWLKMVSDRDWTGASNSIDDLLKLRPNAPRVLLGRGVLLLAAGSLREADDCFLAVEQQAALCSATGPWYCWSNYLAGDYENALFHIKDYRASGRSGPIVDAIEALCCIQIEEADALVERLGAFVAESPDQAMLYGALGYAYGLNGQCGKATEILNTMTHPGAHSMKDEFYAIGLVLLGLNRKQEAVNSFQKTYRDGLLWSLGFRSDPILATLQDDPHYQTFMSRVTFPDPEIADPKLGFVG